MIRARELAGASLGIGVVTIWLALLGLITTPYLIHHLGVSFYGVFGLITIAAGYLSNLELGFGHATVRFLARARGTGDSEAEDAVVRTSFAVFLIAGITGAVLAVVFADAFVDAFVHGSAALRHQAVGAVRLGGAILMLSLLSAFAASALQALGHFQVVVTTRAISGTAASGSAIGTVAAGGGLRSVLAAQAVVALGACIRLLVAVARATRAPLRPRMSRPTFRAMAGFGALVLLAGIAYQTMLQAPPIVLAGNASTAEVAAFAVPNVVLQQLVLLATATSLGFLPFVSGGSASKDRSHLANVYLANLRLTLLLMAPIAAYLTINGHPLLTTWISRDFADAAIGPLRYLAVAAVALAISSAPSDVARGLGRPSWPLAFSACAAAVSVAGSFVAVTEYGATGVSAALCLGLSSATILFVFVVGHALLHVSPIRLLRALARPLLAIAGGVALFAAGHVVWHGFAGAVGTGAVGVVVYLALAFALVLDSRERAALRGVLSKER